MCQSSRLLLRLNPISFCTVLMSIWLLSSSKWPMSQTLSVTNLFKISKPFLWSAATVSLARSLITSTSRQK